MAAWPGLVGAAPFDAGEDCLLALWNIEFDEVRNGDGLREDDACAVFRQVAHQAGRLAASFVEINDAAQEALLASACSAFVHRFVHRKVSRPNSGARIVW